MELKKGQKIALVTLGLIGMQTFVIWVSYNYGNNDGFRAARIGYMKQPSSDGTITIGEKGKVTFTPTPTGSVYDSTGPWNSKGNREYVERQHFNMGNTQYGKWVQTRVASATCSPTKRANRWYCKFRELGESFNRYQIIEVNPKSGDWQGMPQ